MKKAEEKNENIGNKILKVLFNQISFFIAMVAAIVSITNAVNKPDAEMRQNIALIKKDIETINTNHFSHLQVYAEEVRTMNEEIKIMNTDISSLYKIVIENQTLIKTHMGMK